MPPPLAALLCVGFILWLFRRHSKEAAPMSPGLWVAFLWVVIIASRPVGYWFVSGTAAADVDGLEGSPFSRNAYLALIILALIVLARRPIEWNSVFYQCRWLLVLYAYFLLSVLWSEFSFVAIKRWIKEFGNVLMILIILTEKDPLQAIRGVFLRSAYVLIPVSVLFIKYFPELGRYYSAWTWQQMYSGVTTNKNSLGLAALVSGVFLIWEIAQMDRHRGKLHALRKKWPQWAVLLMSLWILWIAGSSTATACFLLSVATLFIARRPWFKANLGIIYCCGFGVAVVLVAFTVLPEFRGIIAGLLNRDVTLTNRTVIWEAVLKMDTNPILGAGFMSAWLKTHPVLLAYDLEGLPHCHNGYLETYLHTGLIGVLLLVFALFAAVRNAVTRLMAGAVIGPPFVALFLGTIFYNYAEVAFNNCNIFGFTLWLTAASGVASQALSQVGFARSDPDSDAIEPEPPIEPQGMQSGAITAKF